MEGFMADNTRRRSDIPVRRAKEHWKLLERHSIFTSDFDQHTPEGEGCDAYRSILISLLSSPTLNETRNSSKVVDITQFESAAK
jgi:hypothetical protein